MTALRRIHVIGDTHFGGVDTWRVDIMLADMARTHGFPTVDHRINVGDFIGTSTADQAITRAAYGTSVLNTLGGTWSTTIGNHDEDGRSTAEAAAVIGQPAINYTVDLGYCAVINLYVRQAVGKPVADTAWLDAQLTANAGKPCLIVGHAPLYNTVGLPSADKPAAHRQSIDGGWYAYDDAAIRAVIAAHSNVIAYLSGHTHPQPYCDNIVRQGIGLSTDVLHVNVPSIYTSYPISPDNWIGSTLLTINDAGTSANAYQWDHRTGYWYDTVPDLTPVPEPPPPYAGRHFVKTYDEESGEWVRRPVKVWNGSEWQPRPTVTQ